MIAAPQDLACEKATVAGPLRIGIGCMALTGLYGSISASDARNVLDVAAGLGFRLFDTAPLYANGNNEELIGEVFGSRASISVSTKFGLSENNDNKLVRDSRPSSIRASVEASLGRLRRERIDLLIQHRPDPDVDDQEVAGAVQNLIDEGKVASFGLLRADCVEPEKKLQPSAISSRLRAFKSRCESTGTMPSNYAALLCRGYRRRALRPSEGQ